MKTQPAPRPRTPKKYRTPRRAAEPTAPTAVAPGAHPARKGAEQQTPCLPYPPKSEGASGVRAVRSYPAKQHVTCSPLFPGMDSFARQGLTILWRVLDEIMPLNAARRRDLPVACRELSALLTTERSDLSLPYWTTPRLTSAYLRYFLPWNLIRLLPLLPSLPLTLPASASTAREAESARTLIVDLGSGPFTLPLALWLGRPDFRAAPITLICADTAPHPLHLGRDIFEALRRELDPSSPWEIHALRAPLGQALHRLRGRPWLISAGNVLNELEEKSRRAGAWQDKISAFAQDAARILLPGGFLFGLEPGTRQGAKLIRALRETAMYGGLPGFPDDDFEDDFSDNDTEVSETEEASAFGTFDNHSHRMDEQWTDGQAEKTPRLVPLSPCPHAEHCPMDRPGTSAWCHVNAPASDAPGELRTLSRRAGLDKDSVSLSFLLLHKPGENEIASPASRAGTLPARLLSEPFILPGYPGRARYACTPKGLALVPDCAMLPPGALCTVEDTPCPPRDRKSGALILPLFLSEVSSTPQDAHREAAHQSALSRTKEQNRSERPVPPLNNRGRSLRNGDARKTTAPRQDKASEPRRSRSRKKYPNPRTGWAKRQA